MATEQNKPLNHPRRTQVYEVGGQTFYTRLENWLIQLLDGGKDTLFFTPDEQTLSEMWADGLHSLGDIGLTIEFVDWIENKPWMRFQNVNQYVFVCNDTETYFVVRRGAKSPHMAIRALKKQPGGMQVTTVVGNNGRLGIDISGSMCWMANANFISNNVAHFPKQWIDDEDLEPSEEQKRADAQKVHAQLTIIVDAVEYWNAEEKASELLDLIEANDNFEFVENSNGFQVIDHKFGLTPIEVPAFMVGDEDELSEEEV